MTLINQAIDTTRDLIAGHDSDTRYDEVPCRSAVAALYLPIVGLVIGALQQLHGYGSEENSSITPDVAMAIATSSIMGGLAVEENKGDLSSQVCCKQGAVEVDVCFLSRGIFVLLTRSRIRDVPVTSSDSSDFKFGFFRQLVRMEALRLRCETIARVRLSNWLQMTFLMVVVG